MSIDFFVLSLSLGILFVSRWPINLFKNLKMIFKNATQDVLFWGGGGEEEGPLVEEAFSSSTISGKEKSLILLR